MVVRLDVARSPSIACARVQSVGYILLVVFQALHFFDGNPMSDLDP